MARSGLCVLRMSGIAIAAALAIHGSAIANSGVEVFDSTSGGLSFFSSLAGSGTFSVGAGGGASFADTISFDGLLPNQFYSVTLSIAGYRWGSGATVGLQGATSSAAAVSYTPSATFPSALLVLPAFKTNSSGDFILTLSAPAAIAGARYTGSLSVALVPEPETSVMLLAGLGVVGLAASQRRKRAASA